MQQSTQPQPQSPPPQRPLVVEVVRQPPVAREIGMGDVVLGAVGLTGAIILAALLAGVLAGALIIFLKRWRNRARGDGPDDAAARLRL